jgi:cell wall-associated NlpC family hydrolase
MPRCCLLMALALLGLLTGCAGEKAVVSPELESGPALPKTRVPRLGYAIQVGAFLNFENAVRLTESLDRNGLNPYYFRDKKGLYKVRFGDFYSRDAARSEAVRLKTAGMIRTYYIVSPDDYAWVKKRAHAHVNLRDEIVETAEGFIGLPYRWGGASEKKGFDCSGLTMAVYQLNGLNLPRSSREQYRAGIPVSRSKLEKGDLVFFSTSRGNKVSHVGVYADDNRFIHAPGKGKTIREDSLSNGYYAARYVGARTYLK